MCKKIKIKWIILFIMIPIMVIEPTAVRASSAGTLTVSGGTWQGTGNRAAAITLIMMVAQSLGFTWHLSQAAVDAGESISDQVDKLVDRWVADGAPVEVVTFISGGSGGSQGSGNNDNNNDNNNNNNKIGRDGKVYIGAGALYFIARFFNWLKAKGFLKQNNSGNVGNAVVNGTYYGDMLTNAGGQGGHNVCVALATDTASNSRWDTAKKVNVAWIKYRVSDTVWRYMAYYPRINFEETRPWLEYYYAWGNMGKNSGNQLGYRTYDNISFYYIFSNELGVCDQFDLIYDATDILQGTNYAAADRYFNYINYAWSLSDPEPDETYLEGDYSESDLDNQNNYYTVIDPNILNDLKNQLAENTNATIGIQEYLKAIQNSLNQQAGEQASQVKATDNSTLEEIDLPVPSPSPYDTELPADQDDPTDVVTPPETAEPVDNPDGTPDPEKALPLITFDLSEYFPFCVPFDCYKLFQKLSGTPVAPQFTISFHENFSNCDVNFNIDLSPFSSAMVLIRRFETFAYVIGLAIVSRKIYAR